MHQGTVSGSMGLVRVHQVREVTVIAFHGEVDIAALRITPALDEVTASVGRTVVIDLSPAQFFDCAGLQLLCRAERRVRERGGRVLVVCPSPLIRRILLAAGLTARFAPLTTLEEALALCGADTTS